VQFYLIPPKKSYARISTETELNGVDVKISKTSVREIH